MIDKLIVARETGVSVSETCNVNANGPAPGVIGVPEIMALPLLSVLSVRPPGKIVEPVSQVLPSTTHQL